MNIPRAVALIAHPSTVSVAAVATASTVRDPALTKRFLIAMPLSIGIAKVLKHRLPRQKPRLLSITPRQSFPSGHEAAITAFAASLVDGLGIWKAAPIAAGAVAFVGACRIKAREHRLDEVLVGCAVGLGAAVVASLVSRAIDRRRAKVAAPGPALKAG